MSVHFCHCLSISVSVSPFLSLSVRFCQCQSISVIASPFLSSLSISVNVSPFLSLPVHFHQASPFLSMSVHFCHCQSVSVRSVRFCHRGIFTVENSKPTPRIQTHTTFAPLLSKFSHTPLSPHILGECEVPVVTYWPN